MKDRMYVSLWWSMRLYVLLFAGFIAAFGAFRWRLPAYRQHANRSAAAMQTSAMTPPRPTRTTGLPTVLTHRSTHPTP